MKIIKTLATFILRNELANYKNYKGLNKNSQKIILPQNYIIKIFDLLPDPNKLAVCQLNLTELQL